MAQGEVEDLYTPEHIKEAAQQALRDNRSKYTPTAGIPELREAIAYRLAQDNGIQVPPSQVMASTGAKQCIFNFMLAVLDPGDEVLLPAPYWVSFPYQVELAGGRPVVVPVTAETGYKVTGDVLRRFLSPQTRVLVLNTPNNPSGAVYTKEELEDILEVALAARLFVIADEVYDRLTYDGHDHVSFAALSTEAAAVTVTVNAVSKTYCMTGWRLGFAAGPREFMEAMERIQSHSTSAPNSIAQWAAVAALTGDQSTVTRLRSELESRRHLVQHALQAMPRMRCQPAQGGLFAFPSVDGVKANPRFAHELLEATGVKVVAGDAFGMEDHIRLCFGTSRATLEQAMEKMDAWLRVGASDSS